MGCQNDSSPKEINTSDLQADGLFSKISSSTSGLKFRNDIKETKDLNYLNYLYAYNGAGIAVGDIDGDGLEDLFFTANQSDARLFKNLGDLKFEDISKNAGIQSNTGWQTGCTMADVNGDGMLDIYVCQAGPEGYAKENKLYINLGGGHFQEDAKTYGLNINTNSTQASFLDYDLDGDLDVYIVSHPSGFPKRYDNDNTQIKNPSLEFSDLLLENRNNRFVDVSKKAGVLNFAFGLNASVSDINQDGYPDIYVTSDFGEADFLYINKQNGTFKNEILTRMGQISQYSMGSDIGDINNDGNIDLMTVDMSPEDNYRHKMMMGAMTEDNFRRSVAAGNHHQYMYNTLQLNTGNAHFSNIAMLSGVATTDWSWSPLIADFDNDGLQDISVTNGVKRDVLDNDFRFRITEKTNQKPGDRVTINVFEALETYTSTKLPNYMFKNIGGLRFENVASAWGLDMPSFSNGSVAADLDNDGDLELVVNNVDDEAFLYKNNSQESFGNNFLKIQLKSQSKNTHGVGALITIKTDEGLQVQELNSNQGYLSSSGYGVLFGVKQGHSVQSLHVKWPSGKEEKIQNPELNKTLVLHELNAEKKKKLKDIFSYVFTEEGNTGLNFIHNEAPFNDMQREILIPHKLSNNGPCIASDDVNGDGFEDVFVGGSASEPARLFLQDKNGKFTPKSQSAFLVDKLHEDVSAVFFDIDGDQDQDIYVVSGSNEKNINDHFYLDRLYINDGKGNFKKDKSRIPEIKNSGSVVIAEDFDKDNDIDLIIGTRSIPGHYGLSSSSVFLKNEGGVLKDFTEQIAPEFKDIGMVTDAIWEDVNGDAYKDVILVGEWMPITVFEYADGKYVNRTDTYGLESSRGWWNSIEAQDLDKDGDLDFVVGNLGQNYKYQATEEAPFELFVNDFDANGTSDIILSYYQNGESFPVRGRNCSMQQMPNIQKKFPNYATFASANTIDIYGNALKKGVSKKVEEFSSVLIKNDGVNKLELIPLPVEAQLSSINDILVEDVNKDGHQDLVLAGNLYQSEAETPRADGSYGVVLQGDSNFGFKPIPIHTSRFFVQGEVKSFDRVQIKNKRALIVGLNKHKLRIFSF